MPARSASNSCAAAVDILIALALVYILARTKSDFKDTSNIIKRLIYGSVKVSTSLLCCSASHGTRDF